MKDVKKIRTRFAPSPTGSMHIGNLRTALYAFALAKHKKGDFILRIEDTDKKREEKGGVEAIKKILTDLDLKWDEYYVQSERLHLYKQAAEKLVKVSHAFYCQCEAKNAKEDGFSNQLRDPCRDKNLKEGAIKLKIEDNQTLRCFDFVLKEEVSWKSDVVFDATLLKSDGYPTYHLASVVDDHEMEISHVLRGHDWLPSTPIHILLYKYFGFDMPQIGHLTDILDPEGGKLSKRKGSVSVESLLSEGYLSGALLNFIMLLGWAPKDDREMFSLDEFIDVFDEEGLQVSNPIFNKQKLNWFGNQYFQIWSKEKPDMLINEISKHSKLKERKNFADILGECLQAVSTRSETTKDVDFYLKPFYEEVKVDKTLFGDNYRKHLEFALDYLKHLDNFSTEKLTDLAALVKEKGFKVGDFFMDLRIALTGEKITMPINDFIVLYAKYFDKEVLIERIGKMLE